MDKTKLGIIIGSTRPGRFADTPAALLERLALEMEGFEVDVLDLRAFDLPFFAEEASPARGKPASDAAREWAARLASCDAFVATVAEYNHGPTAVLKNALDYAYAEWKRKPIGFFGYGGVGGARAVEQLRLVAIELQMVPVHNAVHLQMADFMAVMKGTTPLGDLPHIQRSGLDMLAELRWWAELLKDARQHARGRDDGEQDGPRRQREAF
ncbi:NADPH-dependent FMN reductase [Bosea sp. PAMC 26642]|uniref:NADPH-dependent FMN reductase n=1 Tax=Bosea sp. (strain PAMC 26642) TaxID=1792307 RepID=UPI00076FED19|nr:NAD(P)H-dependent oxidoreductase [Bosea sp. PAMC 26642]AMJ59994.1 hypothetical protein AXW83_06500 [Bosea sp. PAMC 26642]